MKKFLKSNLFITFFLSVLIASFFIIPQIIKNSGIFMISADFNYQQIPFNELANELIKQGNTNYTWLNDLGSNFIGSFSFYNLGSPFFWITLLFPAKLFKYLSGPIFILKYASASIFAFIYLKRYVKNEKYAIWGSLLYSFSGFQITNMLFYHFHDVVALFPLLLIGLDKFMYDNKKGLWGFAVFLCALSNFFFFIGEVVFIFIYFLVKFLVKEYPITLRKLVMLIFETFIGFGMSCIIFIPSILFTLTNPRTQSTWTLSSALKPSLTIFSGIVRAMFLPSQVMSKTAFFEETNFSSVELYLPLVSSLLYLSYILKKRKTWLTIMIFISILFMFIPILNSTFVALNSTYYARWFYMPILLMSLASIKVLDEKLSIIPGIIGNFILLAIFSLLYIKYKQSNIMFIYNKPLAITYCIEYTLGILLTIVFVMIKNENTSLYLLTLFTSLFIIFNGFVFFKVYFNITNDLRSFRDNYYNASFYLDIDDNVRIDTSESYYYNYSYIARVPTLKNWNSTINGNIIRFYNSLNVSRGVFTALSDDEYDLRNLLSVKYIITQNSKFDREKYEKNYHLIKETENYLIFYNDNYLEIGHPYKYYLTVEDFIELPEDQRKHILCYSILLKHDQINKYDDFMQNIMSTDISLLNNNHYNSNTKLIKTKQGFNYEINQEEKSLVLFSIPYESNGWHAEENGKNIPIEIVDNGLMAIPIEAGSHTIKFTYSTPGLKCGTLISIVSTITFIIYLIILRCFEKRETSN